MAKAEGQAAGTGDLHNNYAGNFAGFLRLLARPRASLGRSGLAPLSRTAGYEYGVGRRMGKKLSDIDRVPKYWPDNEVIRNDMLDYSIEVEHYDNHLGKIVATLEAAGQLDNTLIVATSDHSMPFPRVKGQAYESSSLFRWRSAGQRVSTVGVGW